MPELGWFKVWRGWRDNPVLCDAERRDAWLWLIENAAWKPVRVRVGGRAVAVLNRGELSFSQRFLADQWGWSKSRVDRFLADLKAAGMIETRLEMAKNADQSRGSRGAENEAVRGPVTPTHAGQSQTIITICNYARYQCDDDGERTSPPAVRGAVAGAVPNVDKSETRAKEEEEKKEEYISNSQSNPSRARAREDAAARLDGWTEEQIEDVLAKVADAAGLSLVGAKRKADARAILVGWLEGWPSCDVETDLVAPIRAFLFAHGEKTGSLNRFDAVIRDRKARAGAKPAAASAPAPAKVDRAGEGEQERRIRRRAMCEDGLLPGLVDRCALSLNCTTLHVVCPDAATAATLRKAEQFGGSRLLTIARTVAGTGIATVTITAGEAA